MSSICALRSLSERFVITLAEEVGKEEEKEHEDGKDEEDDLQPLVELATELD